MSKTHKSVVLNCWLFFNIPLLGGSAGGLGDKIYYQHIEILQRTVGTVTSAIFDNLIMDYEN